MSSIAWSVLTALLCCFFASMPNRVYMLSLIQTLLYPVFLDGAAGYSPVAYCVVIEDIRVSGFINLSIFTT